MYIRGFLLPQTKKHKLSALVLLVLYSDGETPASLMLQNFAICDLYADRVEKSAEDEVDLSKVTFDKEAFRCFAKGFLSQMKDKITKHELELLPFSVKLLTYENGIRFLADYLDGDVYFRIHRENHNLDRARNQLKLVYELLEIVYDLVK